MGEFEKNLKDIFENAEMQPSEQLWDGLESKLKASKKRGIIIYLQQYGVAAAVVLTLGVGYLLYDQVFTQNSPIEPTEELAKKQEEKTADTEKSTNDSQKENKVDTDQIEEIQEPIQTSH